MGRPELPVDFSVQSRGKLATGLRELRTVAGLTYEELAAKTGVSPATLKRAASGRTVPSWETITAIVAVCGDLAGVDGMVVHLWQLARIVERDRLSQLRRPGSPELVTTRGALSEALEYFYERAGALPLRRLRALAGGAHLLPVSSAARIVNREALPASRQQCAAFLTACGVGPRLVERWAEAFDRIMASRDIVAQRLSDAEAMLALTLGGRSRRTAERYWAERRPARGKLPPSRYVQGGDMQALFELPDDEDLRAA
ncbi:helix-turn-helix transcriptional regulator [Streptomyces sp. H27-H1]|uniref:helix-turn-helix domain-containing protein n=1 Tax=Streptomyces sp. H27-H1 TaxID=2996461 RepID=UPI00226FB09E|nr:helix-turn-helix transcriptional regulator [Streptomyces sp. H27-H1]MCY0931865.1 helix-turn-helix transcriptional regulator [Streptomyces sp. H27-H1]